MLGNAIIDSRFNYAPLIWMFCRKVLYLKMQKIHHKTLKVIYQSNKTYDKLLELSETVSIHQRQYWSYWSLQKYFLFKPQVYVLFLYS